MSSSSLPAPDTVCGSTHCVTCGDDGEPMLVININRASGLAVCRGDEGEDATVEIALIDSVALGDRLLVHAGTAIARLDQEGAIAAA